MGTRTASGEFRMDFRPRIENDLGDSTAAPSVTVGDVLTQTFTTGTSANQINRCYSNKAIDISSGANEDIDVYDFGTLDAGAGAAADALGQTVSLVEVCFIAVHNHSSVTGVAVVGGLNTGAAFNTPFAASDAGKVSVLPGGWFILMAPVNPAYAVADTDNHILRINALGSAVKVDVHIFGRSA